MVEFNDREAGVFDEIMAVLKKHPVFENFWLTNETVLSLPGLEIYPARRKVYRDQQEICLTAKEYELLNLLVANRGRVLTYEQIYQTVWGGESAGSESNTVGCHIRNLRGKLYAASTETPFNIRCVREVGYCFEMNKG